MSRDSPFYPENVGVEIVAHIDSEVADEGLPPRARNRIAGIESSGVLCVSRRDPPRRTTLSALLRPPATETPPSAAASFLNLRYSSTLGDEQWFYIVLGGMLKQNGMVSFSKELFSR